MKCRLLEHGLCEYWRKWLWDRDITTQGASVRQENRSICTNVNQLVPVPLSANQYAPRSTSFHNVVSSCKSRNIEGIRLQQEFAEAVARCTAALNAQMFAVLNHDPNFAAREDAIQRAAALREKARDALIEHIATYGY